MYGSLFVAGPISVRHIVTVIMLIASWRVSKTFYSDKFFNIYLVFIACFFLSSLMSGFEVEAIKRIIGYYFVSYVGLFSTSILVMRYRAEKVFFYTLCVIGLLDAMVTIGQLFQNPIVSQIVTIMRWDVALDNDLEEMQSREDFGLGYIMPGIFGVVANSYFLMTAAILSMFWQIKKFNILGLAVSGFLLFACFVVQERSSFYLAGVFVLMLLLTLSMKRENSVSRILSPIMVIIGILYLLDSGIGWIESSGTRMSDMESLTGRDNIWNNVFEYINKYPVFAGYDRMMSMYNRDAHNLILNAYVFGGFFGFISIMILLIKQFRKMFVSCVKKIKTIDPCIPILSCSYVAYTINGMVHNLSIVYGNLDVWLLWAAFFTMVRRDESNL